MIIHANKQTNRDYYFLHKDTKIKRNLLYFAVHLPSTYSFTPPFPLLFPFQPPPFIRPPFPFLPHPLPSRRQLLGENAFTKLPVSENSKLTLHQLNLNSVFLHLSPESQFKFSSLNSHLCILFKR